MSTRWDKQLDAMDASVFSSDMMFDPDRYPQFKAHVERWSRAIAEHEGAAALAREQEAQPFPEDAVTFLREHGYEWSADILARERNKVTKEEMGRVVLEASTGMHGDIAKALALELCAVLAPTVGYLASDGYFIASQDYVRVHGQVPRGSPLFLRAAQPAAQEPKP
jgi:hypothetical protein